MTEFRSNTRARPSRTTAQIPATKVSISINRVRYDGNLDANIRLHINGGYLRNYCQTKHSWSKKTWYKIDMSVFGRHMEKIPATNHTRVAVTFVHDNFPLGNQKFELSTTNDPKLISVRAASKNTKTTTILYTACPTHHVLKPSKNS